jgi:hypothetical protein
MFEKWDEPSAQLTLDPGSATPGLRAGLTPSGMTTENEYSMQ